MLAETKSLIGAEKYNSNKAISILTCQQLELVNYFLKTGISLDKSIINTHQCIGKSRKTGFTAIEIAYSLKDKEYLKNIEENRLKIEESQRPMSLMIDIKDSLSKNIVFEQIKFAEYKKESENKILELNKTMFRLSVISIFAILVLLIALMLYYTSAYDEGYKNGAKDTQKLYQSLTNQK